MPANRSAVKDCQTDVGGKCLRNQMPLAALVANENLATKIDTSCICIVSVMSMKNSAGEECVIKFQGSRDGFHRICLIDVSAFEYAPLIGSYGLQFRFCPVIG